MPDPRTNEPEIRDEPPPILGTWPRVYVFVLSYLGALIVLFYAFTVYFTP